MSQTTSPWNDKGRVSSLRENLGKPFEYSPVISNDRSSNDRRSNTRGENKSGPVRASQSSSAPRPSSENDRLDPQFRRWRNFYELDLNAIYDITLIKLKEITPSRKGPLEKRIAKEDFCLFIYKHTSSFSRKI